jgi:hypothetical protein
VRVPLVPSFLPCAAPNRTHGAPLSFGSCNPAEQTSGNVTIGSPDANGAGANSVGFVALAARLGNPDPPDDSDIAITASITDVRCKALMATCAGGALSDYTGQLQWEGALRVTDRFNGTSSTGGTDAATVSDMTLPVTIPCLATTGTTIGATCSVSTTANAVVPGAIKDNKRAVTQVLPVRVMDGGPDGLASTPDNSVFAVQGVFVP